MAVTGLSRFLGVIISCAGLLAFAGAPLAADQQGHGHAPAPMKPMASRGPMKPHVGPLPPIPYEGYPSPRPMAVVQAAYEFAARQPQVLQYMPCFCGCERGGHAGNHDCFVRSRDANGKVTWDSHGYGCAICIDVAYSAMQMFNSGASTAQIRTAIDQKYASRFPTSTPTPKPPVVSKK
ncbi:MAG: PCYCGC motif-containing (lipo)protein [Vicinamibacterales bacterium]